MDQTHEEDLYFFVSSRKLSSGFLSRLFWLGMVYLPLALHISTLPPDPLLLLERIVQLHWSEVITEQAEIDREKGYRDFNRILFCEVSTERVQAAPGIQRPQQIPRLTSVGVSPT